MSKMKDPLGRATPNQMKYLWSFEIRFGKTGEPAKWFDLNRDGKINKQQASDVISICKQWEENPKNTATKTRVATVISAFSPRFQFKDDAEDLPVPEDKEVVEIIKEVIPEVVLSGDMTIDEVLAALGFLGEENIKVIKQLWNKRPKPKMPNAEVSPDYIKPDMFDEVLLCLKAGSNVLLDGPAGCGKSRMGQELAKAMDLEWFMISGTGGKRYGAVFGHDALKTDDNGKQYTEWQPAPLVDRMQKPHFMQLEEFFSFDPDTGIGFNGVLERNMRAIETPMGIVKVHKKTVFLATANINGRAIENRKFTGTKKADESLNDRFVCFHVDYDKRVEEKLLENCSDPSDALFLSNTLHDLRHQINISNISFDPSTRRLVEAINLVNKGLPRRRAFQVCFMNHLSTAEKAKISLPGMEEPEKPTV